MSQAIKSRVVKRPEAAEKMTFARGCQVRLPALLLLLLPAWWLGCGLAARAQSDRGVSNGADQLTSIPLTLTDKNGAPLALMLRPQDVRVLEDGEPQEIVELAQRADAPRWVVLGLDTSISQEYVLPLAKEAARHLLERALRPDKDRAAIYSFSRSAEVRQSLTGEFGLVLAALDRLRVEIPPGNFGGLIIMTRPPAAAVGQPVAGSTSLWGGIAEVNEQVFPASDPAAFRAIVILTDGQDTSSQIKKDEAIKRLLKNGVAVYAIGLGDVKSFGEVDKSALRSLAERTGGLAFFPRQREELLTALTRIERGLYGQHFISYRPPRKHPPATFHELKIEIVNPALRKQGVRLAYPRGRFAAPAHDAPAGAKP
jgi:VWFA-related protein